ncbi:MAG: hypothetical protein Q4A52_08030, partial [Bacillota bacterium]|nr:hypothetical protein [Bacillota bacterium]
MSDSKLFKSSRVVLGDRAYMLKMPAPTPPAPPVTETEAAGEESVPQKADLLINPLAHEELTASLDRQVEQIIEEADKEALEIIKKAKDSAESIIFDAYEQAKGILEKAKSDGYALGVELGKTESLDQYYQTLREIMEAK